MNSSPDGNGILFLFSLTRFGKCEKEKDIEDSGTDGELKIIVVLLKNNLCEQFAIWNYFYRTIIFAKYLRNFSCSTLNKSSLKLYFCTNISFESQTFTNLTD